MFDHDYFEGVLPDTRVSKCVKLVVGEDQTVIKIKLLKNSFVIFKKNYNLAKVGGRLSTEVAFALHTHQPRVQILALPIFFLLKY